MSRPRAATSVVSRMSICSSLKALRDSRRCAWDIFPWSSPTLSPRRPRTIWRRWHCCFVRMKTIAWSLWVLSIKTKLSSHTSSSNDCILLIHYLHVRKSSDARTASWFFSCVDLIRTNSCCKFHATARLLSTKILTGFRRDMAASSLT